MGIASNYTTFGLRLRIYSIPDIGSGWDNLLMLTSYLLATSFFGLTGSFFFTDSESPILMITFFSAGLIFLSGVSYPMKLMLRYWKAIHCVISAPCAP